MSAGALPSVSSRVGGAEAPIDRDGKRYLEKGLKHAAPTGRRIEQMLVDDPLLLRTPIVRDWGRVTISFPPDGWLAWIDESKK